MVEGTGRLREAVGLDKRFAGSPVASVIGAGLTEYARGVDRPGAAAAPFEVAEVVNRAMERSKERELAGLRRGCRCWRRWHRRRRSSACSAPSAASSPRFRSWPTRPRAAAGLAPCRPDREALVTTAVGLGVAIIAVWFYNYFTARLDDITIDIDETASELVDTILRGHPA